MPSLSGIGSDLNKPTRKPSAKKPAAQRKRVPDKSEGKKKGKKAAVDLETPQLAEAHEHFLKSLKEEAKAFNDPLLLYLYDMVIYRIRDR